MTVQVFGDAIDLILGNPSQQLVGALLGDVERKPQHGADRDGDQPAEADGEYRGDRQAPAPAASVNGAGRPAGRRRRRVLRFAHSVTSLTFCPGVSVAPSASPFSTRKRST